MLCAIINTLDIAKEGRQGVKFLEPERKYQSMIFWPNEDSGTSFPGSGVTYGLANRISRY